MQLLNTGGEGGKRDWKGKRGLGRKKRRGGYHWMIAVYYERRGGLCIFLFIGWVGFRSLSPAFRPVSLSVSFVKSLSLCTINRKIFFTRFCLIPSFGFYSCLVIDVFADITSMPFLHCVYVLIPYSLIYFDYYSRVFLFLRFILLL